MTEGEKRLYFAVMAVEFVKVKDYASGREGCLQDWDEYVAMAAETAMGAVEATRTYLKGTPEDSDDVGLLEALRR